MRKTDTSVTSDKNPFISEQAPLYIAIGDIHGQNLQLERLLAEICRQGLRDEDKLIFLGDYIDRGPDSYKVVELLIKLKQQRQNTVFLRGNHEQLLLDTYAYLNQNIFQVESEITLSTETQIWLQNGGIETLSSYGVKNLTQVTTSISFSHLEFYNSTECEFIADEFHFVHAGLVPDGMVWEDEEDGGDPRIWIREPFLSSKKLFRKKVAVFGHTPQLTGEPLVQRNKIGIDTGAVFGGPLTAVVLASDRPLTQQLYPYFIQMM